MKVYILTPENIIYKGQAYSLLAPGTEGLFQLLDNHISMIALLREGNIRLYQGKSFSNFGYLNFNIKIGLLKVKKGMVKIFIN